MTTATRVLGDYDIIKPIGSGTLGQVVLAEHRFMRKPFVLKLLPPELSEDRSFVQRFQEEAGRLAALDHPHIVKIHNVSFADGVYFLVSDCVVDAEGESCNLGQFMRTLGRPFAESEVVQILGQVASALDYARQTHGGMPHRGLKLSNILVTQTPIKGIEVHLTDFGLTRIVGVGAVLTRIFKEVAEAYKEGRYPEKAVDSEQLSFLHQRFLQNYHFLAPEQKDLRAQVGPEADVYAFGVLAYHLLTGKYPEGVFEPVARQRSDCPLNWDGLVRSCLQMFPEGRPDHLEELLRNMGKEPESDGEINHLRPLVQGGHLERPKYDPDPAAVFHTESGVKSYQPAPAAVQEVEPIPTDMVIIKGGTYERGSQEGNRDEMPRHPVHLNSFAIEIHPVTNEQFVRFLEAMGGEKDKDNHDLIRLKDSRIKRSSGSLGIESGYAKHPVVGVTWYGARAYAKWVGKRLPTEAEWEVAAKSACDDRVYPAGDGVEKSQANFFSSDTTAVMSYAPNPAGLYDMAGNVYEWCQDWYGYNSYEMSMQEPDNPTGPLQGVYRVLRGGCWKSLNEDLRCSHRHRNNPGTVNSTYGFRCASDVV